MTPTLEPQPTEIRLTLEITRAATGETEIVELIGHLAPTPEGTD